MLQQQSTVTENNHELNSMNYISQNLEWYWCLTLVSQNIKRTDIETVHIKSVIKMYQWRVNILDDTSSTHTVQLWTTYQW